MENTGADLNTGASEGAQTTNQSTSGQEGAPPSDYAGYKTPEELVTAHQQATNQLGSLQKQVTDLERIKSTNSGLISQLNEKIAHLSGQMEGFRSARPAEPQGPSMEQIQTSLREGKIDEAEALSMVSRLNQQQISAKMRNEFNQLLNQEVGKIRQQTETERYVAKFMSENPGYKEAHDSGKLDKWLTINADGSRTGGEHAWTMYQLETTRAENERIKKEAADKVAAAEKAGLDKGLQLSKSTSAASKVLVGGGGQFTQTKGNFDLTNPSQRRQAASEYLQKIRTTGG